MGPKAKKRAAPTVQRRPAKKQKVTPSSKQSKPNRKEKAFERGYIPIPGASSEHDVQDDGPFEDDETMLGEYGDTLNFLAKLDQWGIARSKKETERLRQLYKPIRKPRVDDLPSVDSHDEDAESWNSDFEDSDAAETFSDDALSDEPDTEEQPAELDSDTEMPYERVLRLPQIPELEKRQNIRGLPIKLSDGRIQASEKVTVAPARIDEEEEDTEDSVGRQSPPVVPPTVEDVATGARFGRLAVIDVIGNSSRKVRIQGAKEQIASICQEIITDPENSLGLLRRLHTFSLEMITSQSHSEPVKNDLAIRKLAVLSQLTVFKDIIPGYRIRALTDKEKAEKVSQMVARTREWEHGLVLVYQSYLRALEAEIKAKSDLSDVALKCMCTLASDVTHFNFRANLVACIVARLSRKTWDEPSDLCLNTLISIFRNDLTGVPSLEAVQLLNRMIKERHFDVRPEVLTCLLYLRLRSELNVRASDSKVDKEDKNKGKTTAKGKAANRPYLSKKERKALKERKEIEREVREAEAEVDKEERARTHTETLKLLFVLYFRILKSPHPTPLLPAALRGISKYAHLVNVDFFKDLMQVLKSHIIREPNEIKPDARESRSFVNQNTDVQHRLLCIVTAFELLSGQGEALNIDLGDFVNHLYAILLPVSEHLQMEDACSLSTRHPTIADMLFRALTLAFSPRSEGMPWRTAAFAKRLLIASLNWPAGVALRALDFVEGLIVKEPKLEALLTTDDRHANATYMPEVDDPQLCHPFGTLFFELLQLQQRHYDSRIRESARRLSRYTRT